jgi:HD superfamily phosphodiesterase
MVLIGQIKSAENQFKQILEGYFASIYDENILPSHGLMHHRRVWLNARELITDEFISNNISDSRLPYSLIIAAYLHDLGISVEHGPDHGKHSSLLCRKFMHQNNLSEEDYPGLLEAIENHDKKDYAGSSNSSFLNLILSVADDLDAFGITGIYRYIEIYSERGISEEMLSEKIRENVLKRFHHFKQMFGNTGPLFKRHQERYKLLLCFFDEYERELSFSKNVSTCLTGRSGIVKLIRHSLEKQNNLDELLSAGLKSEDEFIKNFFLEFQQEIFFC